MYHPEHSLPGKARTENIAPNIEAAERILKPGGWIYIAPHEDWAYKNDPEFYKESLRKYGFIHIDEIIPYPDGFPTSKRYRIPVSLIKAQKPPHYTHPYAKALKDLIQGLDIKVLQDVEINTDALSEILRSIDLLTDGIVQHDDAIEFTLLVEKAKDELKETRGVLIDIAKGTVFFVNLETYESKVVPLYKESVSETGNIKVGDLQVVIGNKPVNLIDCIEEEFPDLQGLKEQKLMFEYNFSMGLNKKKELVLLPMFGKLRKIKGMTFLKTKEGLVTVRLFTKESLRDPFDIGGAWALLDNIIQEQTLLFGHSHGSHENTDESIEIETEISPQDLKQNFTETVKQMFPVPHLIIEKEESGDYIIKVLMIKDKIIKEKLSNYDARTMIFDIGPSIENLSKKAAESPEEYLDIFEFRLEKDKLTPLRSIEKVRKTREGA
jgi:hypothetical protein